MRALLCFLIAGCGTTDRSNDAVSGVEGALRFQDVTEEAGLGGLHHEDGAVGRKWNPEWMGSGGGFVDYDGDGRLDVVLVGGGPLETPTGEDTIRRLRLHRNDGDGSFTDVTAETGLADVSGYPFGVTAADVDNDGDQDLYLTRLAENLLLVNEGSRYVKAHSEAGLSGPAEWSSSAVFFDADHDGWVDLFVGNYVAWDPESDRWCSLTGEEKAYCTPEEYEGISGRYYHNDGSGNLVDQTHEKGFGVDPGKTLGTAMADVNGDGWFDLILANDTEPNSLYQNDGDGTFTERGLLSGIGLSAHGKARAGMGIDVGVIDSTGRPTVFVGNFSNERTGVFRPASSGLYTDVSSRVTVGRESLLSLTFGLCLFDADLDGDEDLLAVNGHMQPQIEDVNQAVTYRQRPGMYLNRGDGSFERVTEALGPPWDLHIVGRGGAYGDYDRDGDLDLLITENDGPVHLWRNELSEGRFLRVRLRGRQSGRDGIGARVVVRTTRRTSAKRVRTGSSYLSQSEKVLTFGLGRDDLVRSVEVEWPGGTREIYQDLDPNGEILIEEGVGLITRGPNQ